jgi:hypothetical protein
VVFLYLQKENNHTNIINDEKMNDLLLKGWSFHIRYNKDDNDLAIFDLQRFGYDLKKLKRKNYT